MKKRKKWRRRQKRGQLLCVLFSCVPPVFVNFHLSWCTSLSLSSLSPHFLFSSLSRSLSLSLPPSISSSCVSPVPLQRPRNARPVRTAQGSQACRSAAASSPALFFLFLFPPAGNPPNVFFGGGLSGLLFFVNAQAQLDSLLPSGVVSRMQGAEDAERLR